MPEDEKTRVLRGPKAADRPAEPQDEGSTRILPQSPVGKGEGPAGPKITFTCPNGHRITVERALAGKRGKCTKCGVEVVIPGAAPDARPPAAAAPPKLAPPPPPNGSPAEAEVATVGPDEEVPGPDSPPGDVAFAIDPLANAPEESQDTDPEAWDFIGGKSASAGEAAQEPGGWAIADGDSPFGDERGNPTAQLVSRLFLERNHGGIIELHLEGGSVILPEWYDANWSRGTHGLFGSRAGESITITAVAWDTVKKVVVRQLAEVPDDMFT